MLDQMSRGRFLLGIGKGISPIEVGYYGVDFKNADKMFAEALAIMMQALTQKAVDFEGEFFRFKNVPIELQPFQKPHPPLWYGVVNPDSAERAAKAGMNFISNSTAAIVKAKVARYTAAYKDTGGEPPKFGMNRYMVLAETEEKALEIGRRAYRRWWKSFMHLWHKHNTAPGNVNYPPEIDGQIADGRAIATTPAKALELLRGQLAESGANYMVCRFAFGDLSLSESMRSLELFQRHVMPGCARACRSRRNSAAARSVKANKDTSRRKNHASCRAAACWSSTGPPPSLPPCRMWREPRPIRTARCGSSSARPPAARPTSSRDCSRNGCRKGSASNSSSKPGPAPPATSRPRR